MGEPGEPEPVKLICGVLAARAQWLEAARERAEAAWGPVDLESEVWSFDFTDYYEAQMGGALLRVIYAFKGLVDPGELAQIKLQSNCIEAGLAAELPDAPVRPVNLDPGYVAPGKLVLATTKDFAHRVYLGRGIYAESTLRWRGGAFEPWPWTYPDYATPRYRDFFARVRACYKEQLSSSEA